MQKVIALKRIEVVDANTSIDWAEKQEWRDWGPPLDLVRGESYRQKALQQLAGKPRVNGYLGPVLDVDRKILAQYEVSWPPYEGEGVQDNPSTKIYTNLDFPPRKVPEPPGYYLGKYYTKYVDTVKELKRTREYEKAEQLLLALVDAVEAESKAKNWVVAPWYYEQLAIIYRKQKQLDKEIAILQRYAAQQLDTSSINANPLLIRLQNLQANSQ